MRIFHWIFVMTVLSTGTVWGAADARATAEAVLSLSGVKAGLCVHLGSADGNLTAELSNSGKFVVHGLETEGLLVEKARKFIQDKSLYGQISVEEGTLDRLPYADNLVNLIVVDDLSKALGNGLSLPEIARTLCPNGVAVLGMAVGLSEKDLRSKLQEGGLKDFEVVTREGVWARYKKPRDPRMDDWPEFRHNAGHNPVSRDTLVGPGNQVRWVSGPYWNTGAGVSVNLSEPILVNGRMFYLEMNWAAEGKKTAWWLMARDAFNGCFLWRQPAMPFKHMLVAEGDRVFTLVAGGQLRCFNAATGEILHTYAEKMQFPRVDTPAGATLLLQDGVLVAADQNKAQTGHNNKFGVFAWDSASPKLLWQRDGAINPVLGGGNAFFHETGQIVCVDLKSGQDRWRISPEQLPEGKNAVITQFSHGKLLTVRPYAKGTPPQLPRLYALSPKDGSSLWNYEHPEGQGASVISFEDEIWLMTGKATVIVILDPATGAEKKKWVHKGKAGSCALPKATLTYLNYGHGGAYLNRKTMVETKVQGVRSLCSLGGAGCEEEIPANGLTYYMPMSCACVAGMRGVFALAGSVVPPPVNAPEPARLVKGVVAAGETDATAPDDWPCYRKDGKRSNATIATGPSELTKIWEAKPGAGPISPLSAANGLIFGADIEGFQVFALEADTGKERWRYTTGGRVDVPPAIDKGLCIFASRDGWIHCLSAKTGQRVWRYRAAPADTRISVSGRLESAWPVIGGVLIQNNTVYFSAGRCYSMDGGIIVGALELGTGKTVWTKQFSSTTSMLRVAIDLLVGDGKTVFMHNLKFDLQTGKSEAGTAPSGCLKIAEGKGSVPLEQIIWQQEPFENRRSALTDGRLDAAVLASAADSSYGVSFDSKEKAYLLTAKGAANWSVKLSFQGLALIAAGTTGYCAGVPADRDPAKPAQLLAFSVTDGMTLKAINLDATPTIDGLTAAQGRIYLATQDGKVLCFGK